MNAIVYTGSIAPEPLLNEGKLINTPLRVVSHDPSMKLDSLSRVNLGKMYPIEYNIKVKDIGMMDEHSMNVLREYRRHIRGFFGFGYDIWDSEYMRFHIE